MSPARLLRPVPLRYVYKSRFGEHRAALSDFSDNLLSLSPTAGLGAALFYLVEMSRFVKHREALFLGK